jgi:hypothetical protein
MATKSISSTVKEYRRPAPMTNSVTSPTTDKNIEDIALEMTNEKHFRDNYSIPTPVLESTIKFITTTAEYPLVLDQNTKILSKNTKM